jgi:hypothetical protein
MLRFVLLLGGLAASAAALADDAVSPYEVVWDSPSEDVNGTVPLGNGGVALNAWIDRAGDLKFYIARTDSWDDNGRLVKVGAVRVRVGGSVPGRTKTFTQRLNAKDGTLTACFGPADAQVRMALWVDAHRPLVCVEVDTTRPTAATATVELWRTAQETLPSVECSDIFCRRPEKTVVEPDTLLTGLADRVGWYHRNVKSVGPSLCARIQDVADFSRPEPLLHRTFGAVVATERPQRVDDRTLRSTSGTRHVFEIFVHTKHPATAATWLAEAQQGLDEARRAKLAARRAAHEQWWNDFWQRSWIHVRQNGAPAASTPAESLLPANRYPVRIGADQHGSSRFGGTFGRVSIYNSVLPDAELERLVTRGPEQPAAARPDCLYTGVPRGPQVLEGLASEKFATGFTVEAWIKLRPEDLSRGGRIVDKITPGKGDGFLLDTYPGTSLRLIVGRQSAGRTSVLTANAWHHIAVSVSPGGRIALFHNGRSLSAGNNATAALVEGDDAQVITRAYALQRFVAACAGRGQYPIKFNGSLFTVPADKQPGDADYRRWGPGYWWQNTRLPYYAMCAAGDFEMMDALFRLYGRELMPLCKFRTRRYLGHGGAFIPECIYFWGDLFTETYGWQPAVEREDKLQTNRYHKWEWVSGLELVGLMLDYYEHTADHRFLRETALPTAQEILTFFDQHYRLGADGKLVMHPAQALETWWDCVNPMPELAGLHATLGRLLALDPSLTTADERACWHALQGKLPALPTTQSAAGRRMLAPAQEFKLKHNIENPELYAVFPFRLWAIDKPHLAWAIEALEQRRDRGAMGWRQDDVFMAYLGLADQAREYVVKRARTKHAASRFPVFWGPNYDWVPDQDHGSVLLKGLQAMLLQTDGRRIYVLPAWPKDWDVDFKLHAPYQTTIAGRVEGGRLVRLDVQPASRRGDVKVWRP